MLGLGLAPLVGGVVLSKGAWDKISPEDQAKVRAAALDAEKLLTREVPKQDAGAVEQMKQRGLTVNLLTAEQERPWRDEAKRFAESSGDRVPPDSLAAAAAALADFRKGAGGGG
jgi:TRAP-type C4-dicarboxylate transport system substrate-binding protein